jgi:hypothetical protein
VGTAAVDVPDRERAACNPLYYCKDRLDLLRCRLVMVFMREHKHINLGD